MDKNVRFRHQETLYRETLSVCIVLARSNVLLRINLKTMKAVTEQNGLSARQKTRNDSRNFFFPLRPAWLLLAISLTISSCHNRTNGQHSAESNKDYASVTRDSLTKPKVNIKVNKHYDDKGNVIGFDSTYTSFYTNVEGDTSQMDSLMRTFDTYFNNGQMSFSGKEFDSLFFYDSLRYPDFFDDDFFLKSHELNDSYLRDMMRRMDSIKNKFYREESIRGKRNESKDL
jgi:hypothetical protein